MKHTILLIEPNNNHYGEEALQKPLGGSETVFILLVRILKKRDDIDLEVYYQDSGDFKEFIKNKKYDLVISYRNPAPLFQVQGKMNVVYLQDLPNQQTILLLNTLFQTGKLNKMIFLSHFQKMAYLQHMPNIDEGRHCLMFENGLDLALFDSTIEKKNEFIYASAPNRGLDVLMKMWPDIHKQLPEYTLKIAGSTKMYNVDSNIESINQQRENLLEVGNKIYNSEVAGIKWLGGLNISQLTKEMESSKALLYPSTFPETCCHVLNTSLHAGTVPIISSVGAIIEKVCNGENGLIIYGDPTSDEFKQNYIKSTVDLIKSNRIERMIKVNRSQYLAYDIERLTTRLVKQLLNFEEQEGRNTKVLGITCSLYPRNPSKTNFKNLVWYSPIDMITDELTGMPTDQARNAAASMALYMQADWLLFLDSDIYVDKHFLTNMIQKADENKADVVVANYAYKEKNILTPTARVKRISDNKAVNCYDVPESELNDPEKYKFVTAGLGATLISTNILRKIGRPQFRTQCVQVKHVGEDSYFYQECEAIGAKVYLTTELPVIHVDKDYTCFGKQEHTDLILPQITTKSNISESVFLIRNSSLNNLKDEKYLEDLISKLGLNNGFNEAYPQYLRQYLGHGLNIWQYPIQFNQYLKFLHDKDINSYIELGLNRGGSFISTIEYINKVQNKSISAIGIDNVGIHPSLLEYTKLNSNLILKHLDSTSNEFKELMVDKTFDLCFIDGEHSYEGCKNDYELMKNKSRILVFHDICDDLIGVKQLWNEIKLEKNINTTLIEFIDQYHLNRKYMGIGVIIKNDLH